MLEIADVHRMRDILTNRPNLVAQLQGHRWCAAIQRAVRARPIVQVAPQPQCPLQHDPKTRAVPRSSCQLRLLVSHRPVETFHMRGVDLPTDAEMLDALQNILQSAELCLGFHLQELASRIANLLDHAYQQPWRRLEFRMSFAATTFRATSVFDEAEDLQDRRRIRQMIVDQQKR